MLAAAITGAFLLANTALALTLPCLLRRLRGEDCRGPSPSAIMNHG